MLRLLRGGDTPAHRRPVRDWFREVGEEVANPLLRELRVRQEEHREVTYLRRCVQDPEVVDLDISPRLQQLREENQAHYMG